ncbi:hypothetical protein F511_39740 [Dorcoceras hygrometricum]|uniref:Uncharacterized protein n=1 Tax=Dorcoceras hygrometricum TaxID=472368 RepID=A0A2Z7BWU1_9LAMI|nr:hypothetical protein F511_39740 [Dorcoceras hygrometricum]
MAAFFFVDAMQVDFTSVLAMEHTGMACMFKTLEETGLKGFLAASGSVYENSVVEFFANAKGIAGTIVSFIANRKLALTKEVFAETFGLPTEGMASFLDITNQTVVEIRGRFSESDVSFKMKIEFCLLHNIMAKALCAKAGSFDVVTSEKFDLMVAITAGLKINWAQVKEDLEESVKLHPQKVSTNKSVHTYIKKNLDVRPAGESSKQTEDTTSETEGGQSHMTKPVENKKRKTEKASVEKPKKMKEKMLENAVDGLELKIEVLESTLVRKFADNQQNLLVLETCLVRHFADSQQHLVD